ncbi:MAG: HlyD family efflux transporter periplasmic adaptor subunit [Clostridia bacterium]
MVKKRKKIVKGKFFIFLFIAFICVGGLLYFLLRPHKEGVLTTASLSCNIPITSVVIRDEKCYSAGKFERAFYIADEGGNVVKDSPIAQVFKWGYSENTMQALLNVQKNIYNEQIAINEGIDIQELNTTNARLKEISNDIRQIVAKTKDGDILTLEREMKTLLASRAIMLKEKTQPNEKLNALYALETEKKTGLSEWMSDYVAIDAGTVSFYFDGYEQVINFEKLNLLNPELVRKIKKGTGYSVLSGDNNIIYRLVNRMHWYIAFLTDDNSPKRLVTNEEYVVSFEGFPDTPYIGKAVRVDISDGSVLNLIEFNQDIENFLSERTLKATVKKDATGMKVNTSAIKMMDGLAYIDVYIGENLIAVPIDVYAISGDYAIIKAQNGQEPLFEGQRYVN